MSALQATPLPEEECDGYCLLASLMIGLSVFALAAALIFSVLNSWTAFCANVRKQKDTVAKDQTYPPGRDPFYLMHTIQFVATILVSDRGQLPASLRRYGQRFQWANFQVEFRQNNLRRTCDIAVRDQVLSTAELCAGIFIGTFLLRALINRLLVHWSKKQIGKSCSPGFLCLGHWEVVVFLVMSMGISITAGKAIRSPCAGWVIIGVTIVVFLPFTGLMILHTMVRNAIQSEPVAAFQYSKVPLGSIAAFEFNAKHICLPVRGCVGQWKMLPGTNWAGFLQVFGKFFEVYRKEVWYYGSILLFKKIAVGLSYGPKDARAASALFFIANVADSIIMMVTQPHVEFKLFCRGILQSLSMTTIAALLFSHSSGTLSDSLLTISVVLITVVLIIIAIIDQAVTAWDEFRQAKDNVTFLRSNRDPLESYHLVLRTESGSEDSEDFTDRQRMDVDVLVPCSSLEENSGEAADAQKATTVARTSTAGGGGIAQARRSDVQSLARSLMNMELEISNRSATRIVQDSNIQGIRDRLVEMGHWHNPKVQEAQSSVSKFVTPWEPEDAQVPATDALASRQQGMVMDEWHAEPTDPVSGLRVPAARVRERDTSTRTVPLPPLALAPALAPARLPATPPVPPAPKVNASSDAGSASALDVSTGHGVPETGLLVQEAEPSGSGKPPQPPPSPGPAALHLPLGTARSNVSESNGIAGAEAVDEDLMHVPPPPSLMELKRQKLEEARRRMDTLQEEVGMAGSASTSRMGTVEVRRNGGAGGETARSTAGSNVQSDVGGFGRVRSGGAEVAGLRARSPNHHAAGNKGK
eukprot:CAMPEP_0181319236 /NCGR_PEP_ID=MMETSP1101-20121128/17458_1 /TAXON_ID=46948 /ORGANISM="Rhodomonas abbreviata, Strain Caron Lab Isolate" /LENGTH=811 /DNA_ID=CAMNT_0023426811 /DNA_START=408 /DNA_END=2843 /DNA_ORIENTATION=+